MTLQDLAEKINGRFHNPYKQWRVESCEGKPYLGTDPANAQWIIWCLDRLEELGYLASIQTDRDHNGYKCLIAFDEFEVPALYRAPTRAEAVTNALAAALGVEE
jgi:hypothetical protein